MPRPQRGNKPTEDKRAEFPPSSNWSGSVGHLLCGVGIARDEAEAELSDNFKI